MKTIAPRLPRRAAGACPIQALLLVLVLTGCATAPGASGAVGHAGPAADPRAHPMFAGDDGRRIAWDELVAALAAADVVIVGEQHDDAAGHAVQRAIVEDAFAASPGSALTMEMLERDEQPLVEDYLEGIIDAKDFAKLTHSENWGAPGRWHDWYQPIIDAARDRDGTVVAANAPRRYVRLAREEGYERLAGLAPPRRAWVAWPDEIPSGVYRERFWEVMRRLDEQEDDAAGDNPHDLDDEAIEDMFRSQLVWDATMAASIAEARRGGASKVVHLVGQFHCDFDGGTTQEVRRRLPGARVLVVSLQPGSGGALRDDDHGRADVVVYTGAR